MPKTYEVLHGSLRPQVTQSSAQQNEFPDIEPTTGIEPVTCCLRNNYSTAELRRQTRVDVSHAAVAASRFWSRVDRSGGPDSCWPWMGCKRGKGYGALRVGARMVYAHRIACESVHGPAPAGMQAAHGCDNAPCCNPRHLRWATPLENSRDCVERGRSRGGRPGGRWTGNSKLTPEKVLALRARRSQGEPLTVLADEFGVSRPTASLICAGKRWKHLPAVQP